MRSRKAQCQAPPDNPETGERVSQWRKKLRWRENIAPKRLQAAQQQCTTHHYDDYDSKQHNYWVELVRVCRLDIVVAAAACCSFRDNENPPPPNAARAIIREWRRAISAQLPAGRQAGWYMYLLAALFSLIARAVRGRFPQTRDLWKRASMG